MKTLLVAIAAFCLVAAACGSDTPSTPTDSGAAGWNVPIDPPVVVDGLRNPTFLFCDQRGLWVSEDNTHRARLLLIDADGVQHAMLTFLKAPQSIVADGKGGYLLAEGGRNRVLHLTPPLERNTAQRE